jgi:NADPH:quinone reductase-like Zn-dependent oxidoreductase
MKAIVRRRYGSPGDVVEYVDTDRPTAGDDEVLIEIQAASVNPRDSHFTRGEPYFIRMASGLPAPEDIRLGTDVAGRIEAVGRNVRQFKPGDQVFGWCKGAFAEYGCAAQAALVTKPDGLTFEQAASVPTAGLTALQGLRNKGRIQSGHRVLINGAAGGIGTFAVQIAKSFGADVTGVCGETNVELVRSIGAHDVIVYTREDFTKASRQYDVILDCAGNRSMLACRRVLSPKGTYVAVGGPAGRWMLGTVARVFTAPLLSKFVSQTMVAMLARGSQADLELVRELITTGKVRPVIERRYRLSEAAEAIRHVGQGHARGKVVIATSTAEESTFVTSQAPRTGSETRTASGDQLA